MTTKRTSSSNHQWSRKHLRRPCCWTMLTSTVMFVISSQTILVVPNYVRGGSIEVTSDNNKSHSKDDELTALVQVEVETNDDKSNEGQNATSTAGSTTNDETTSSLSSSEHNNNDSDLSDYNEGYGADVSFPIHTLEFKSNSWRKEFYNEWLEGCREHYPITEEGQESNYCDDTELERVEQNKQQPSEMMNFTDTGYKKIRAPKDMFEKINKFWKANKDNFQMEEFGVGDTTINHWASEASFVNIKDESNVNGGPDVEAFITSKAETIISEWVGHKLRYTSLYGIRTYYEGAVLSPHVDRNPLICSAIINVDQDVDEPWPLEVYGRDGKAHNITMEPGDMVLYESHSLIHGRPFPLKGRYFANIFIHFEPAIEYEEGIDPSDIVPFYIKPNSTAETLWKNYQAGEVVNVHDAARNGKLDKILLAHKYWEDDNIFELLSSDEYGWQPIHEAAYGGQMHIIKYLIEERGIDVNTLTVADGESPLYLAQIGIEHYRSIVEQQQKRQQQQQEEESDGTEQPDNDVMVEVVHVIDNYKQVIQFLQNNGGISVEGSTITTEEDDQEQQNDSDNSEGEGDEF